jgi:AraC family transcriptional regulator
MILHEFPNLSWLKNQIDQGFSNRGFPSVIIHTESKECFRPDIKGPISLFLNIRGSSLCSVDGHTRLIKEDTFFITNRSQPYTLQIENSQITETFNIHFGEAFAESALNALITSAGNILDKGRDQDSPPLHFFNQLYRRDAQFDTMIDQLLHTHEENGFDKLLFEEQLTGLLTHILLQQREVTNAINRLSPIKQNTRTELYKRLSQAIDYIHTYAGEKIGLDELAATAFLSKFHFLRLFKLTYGSSPYQYIQTLRLQKAQTLLANTALPVSEIAATLGFDNPQSFSRLFFQRLGRYPSHYREQTK